MLRPDIEIYPIDPLDVGGSEYVPALATRILDFSFKILHDSRAEASTREFLSRLVLGHLDVLALVAVKHKEGDYDEVVAHLIAEIQQDGDDKVAMILQFSADPGYSQLVDKGIALIHNWARNLGAVKIRLEASSVTAPLAVWQRFYGKHGFKLTSYVMETDVNGIKNLEDNPNSNGNA